MLLFTLFIVMIWVATGRFVYIVLGLVLFALGAFVAAHFFPQVHDRVTIWLDPWRLRPGSGQPARPVLVLARRGRRRRHRARPRPVGHTSRSSPRT